MSTDDTSPPYPGDHRRDESLSDADWETIDAAIRQLEEAWRQAPQPDIGSLVPPAGNPLRLRLLVELVGVDLEWHWKTAAMPAEAQSVASTPSPPAPLPDTIKWSAGEAIIDGQEARPDASESSVPLPRRPRLADYVTRYSLLGPVEQLPDDLIVAEYYARSRYGDRPTHAEYLGALGSRHPELAKQLQAIDDGMASAEHLPSDLVSEDGPPLSGRVRYFGDYVLLEQLGKGGMGIVHKARQVSGGNRLVAVKMVLASQLADEQAVRRFQIEAKAAANLDHPCIVRIIEIGEHEGRHYFSMDFVDGESLESRLKVHPLPPREAARLMEQVAGAMAYAHSRGVIHRDLKPANILVSKQGEPRVTDFGLAKWGQDSSLTATGIPLGTPCYMPPEQAAGRKDQIGERSDVYSLGATLYAMLTGHPPFDASTVPEVLRQVCHEEPVPLRQANPNLPRDLETICAKCLEKEPRRRYQTARELAEELQRYVSGKTIRARPVSKLARLGRWCKREPVKAALATTALLLLLAVVLAASVGYVKTRQALTVAESQRHRAEAEKTRAEAALAREVAAKRQAEQNLYYARIGLAQQKWQVGEVGNAERLLDACSPQMRNWEWQYLKRLCHLDILTIASHAGRVTCVAINKPGDRIASGSEDSLLEVWDAQTGRLAQTIHVPAYGLAWHPDGRRIAAASLSRLVTIWDCVTGKRTAEFVGPDDRLRYLAFSPQGDVLVVGGMDTSAITLWSEKANSVTQALKWDAPGRWEGGIGGLAFSGDGVRIAAACRDDHIRIWDRASGKCLLEAAVRHPRGYGTLRNISFNSDGSRLVTADDASLSRIWILDAKTGDGLLTFTAPCSVEYVIFSPDDAQVAIAGSDNIPRLYESATGREMFALRGHDGVVTTLAFDATANRIVSSSADGTLKIWNNSKPIVSSYDDGSMRVWNKLTPSSVTAFPSSCVNGDYVSVSWSRDSKRLVTADGSPYHAGCHWLCQCARGTCRKTEFSGGA